MTSSRSYGAASPAVVSSVAICVFEAAFYRLSSRRAQSSDRTAARARAPKPIVRPKIRDQFLDRCEQMADECARVIKAECPKDAHSPFS
mmetsp:Transcript_33310/g.103205  ORF Transcript_33310/g.103205 Transcript_33310/m.103205 type:complete len:89 (+) Transcript_33310:961-1227(+)